MRTFGHPDYEAGFVCKFCQTSADQPVTLFPKFDTLKDGLYECEQVHAECAALFIKMEAIESKMPRTPK